MTAASAGPSVSAGRSGSGSRGVDSAIGMGSVVRLRKYPVTIRLLEEPPLSSERVQAALPL